MVLRGPHLLEYAVKLRKEYGYGFDVTLPGLRMWDISRPDWIEYVQKSELTFPGKRVLGSQMLTDFAANFENYIKVRTVLPILRVEQALRNENARAPCSKKSWDRCLGKASSPSTALVGRSNAGRPCTSSTPATSRSVRPPVHPYSH